VIRLSRTARPHLAERARFDEERDRPDAVRHLRAIIARAGERIERQQAGAFRHPAPTRH
jgi:hypothetical protein